MIKIVILQQLASAAAGLQVLIQHTIHAIIW
jgi:hypothetical protein